MLKVQPHLKWHAREVTSQSLQQCHHAREISSVQLIASQEVLFPVKTADFEFKKAANTYGLFQPCLQWRPSPVGNGDIYWQSLLSSPPGKTDIQALLGKYGHTKLRDEQGCKQLAFKAFIPCQIFRSS